MISGPLSDLGKIDLVRVNSADKALSRLWFDLMVRYHYLGSGTLCGAQVRYLIRSGTKGVVGATSFSSAAWKVAVRDAWIGWSPERRGECLPRVVANSRFLILPHVQVPNLASHILGQLVRRLPGDWEATYGERPVLLETFVEEARYVGTCYRAAGWRSDGPRDWGGRAGGFPSRRCSCILCSRRHEASSGEEIRSSCRSPPFFLLLLTGPKRSSGGSPFRTSV